MFKFKVVIQAMMGDELKRFTYYEQPLSEVMRFLQLKTFSGFEIESIYISFEKPLKEEEYDTDSSRRNGSQ